MYLMYLIHGADDVWVLFGTGLLCVVLCCTGLLCMGFVQYRAVCVIYECLLYRAVNRTLPQWWMTLVMLQTAMYCPCANWSASCLSVSVSS